MNTKIQLAFLLLMVAAVYSKDHKYCFIRSCPYRSHTLCQFQTLEYSEKCQHPLSADFTDSEIKNIIIYHYFLRFPKLFNKPIAGLQSVDIDTIPLPYTLEWDDELAEIAQRWAFQCEDVTDTCRNVDRFNVTQRIDVQESFAHIYEPSVFASIKRWHDEDSDITFENLRSRETSTSRADDSLEIVWKETNRIGCSSVRTFYNRRHQMFVVCNYGYLADKWI